MGKYGIRVTTRRNNVSGDSFIILQYKLNCMNKVKIQRVAKWVLLIASLLAAGDGLRPISVVSEIATQILHSDTNQIYQNPSKF